MDSFINGNELRFLASSDAGMICIWNKSSFSAITDYDSWEKELIEDADILLKIGNGILVPLTSGDGTSEVELRIYPDNMLNSRENEYTLVRSRKYLLKTDGEIVLSGIEHIEREIGKKTKAFKIKPGKYHVISNLIDWNQEPGALDQKGNPTQQAMPDIIVQIEPDDSPNGYRIDIEPYLKEDALRK